MVVLVDGSAWGTLFEGCGSFALCYCFKPSLNSGKRAYCHVNRRVLMTGLSSEREKVSGLGRPGAKVSLWRDGDGGDRKGEAVPRKGLAMGEGTVLKPEGGYEMIECGSRARKVWCRHEGAE